MLSYKAAVVLAGFLPLELLATQYARVYRRIVELWRENKIVTTKTKEELNL